MAKRIIYFFIGINFAFLSCQQQSETVVNDKPVVKVYSKTLYEREVLKNIPFESSMEDSLNIRNNYINNWIDRQLLVHQAELNLPFSEQDVQEKLDRYKNDLLIFAYRNQLLQEKLDTVISKSEIQEYYENNQESFVLVDYILKANYLKLDSTDKNIKKVKKWIVSDDIEDIEKLDNYCYMHSSNYSFDGEWMYLNDLLNVVPIVSYNKERLLKNKKLIELYDNGMYYLVRIVDYKLKDSVSPLSMEYNNIKRIILNNRKLELLEKLSSDIYQDAKKENQIELFKP
ncbi:MAG: hypothetical protein ACPGVC_03945 [Salibacteraceae bacterium]